MKKTTGAGVLVSLVLLAGTARAADIYVSTNGTQKAPYDTWANAFNDLQGALEYAGTKADATIYLAGGQELTGAPCGKEHPNNAMFCWERATNVRLLGGWDTTAAPPVSRNAGLTVLRRMRGDARVMTLSGLSNCVIEQVAFLGGCNAAPGGMGLYFTNCWNVAFADCVVASNVSSGVSHGTGLLLNRSHVVMKNCTIADNSCACQYSGGAGIYVDGGSRLTATRSFLLRNKQGGQGGNVSYAGGFYNLGVLELVETVVSGNEADAHNVAGGAGVNGGTLLMRNCLVMNNKDSGTLRDGILLSGGSATFINCTIVSNNAVGLRYGGGKVAVSNCIVWGHSAADLLDFPKDKAGVMPDVWYSCIGDGKNNSWQGCFQRDPLFVDSSYYHLQSAAGHYANGYFTGGAWAKSAATSPLIDRGAPAPFDFSRESAPNGGRVNIGAYGNTDVASQSPAVTVVKPSARNGGAVMVGHRTVLLRGEVSTGNGQPPAAAFRYWPADGGPTNEIPVGDQFGGFQRTVTNLTPDKAYQFLVAAANPAGAALSETGSFRTHPSPSWLYVATNGDNTAGTNWATAYPDVQTALNLAEPGDTICVAGQVFAGGTAGTPAPHPNNAVLIWRNASDVTVRGGYDATAGGGSDPGPRTGEPTVIQRTLGNGIRVMTLAGVTNCTIEQVTIRDGSDPAGGGYGVYLTNCWDVTFAGCLVSNNSGGAFSTCGLGLLLNRSSAVLTNTTIANNVIRGLAWGCAGGGIYVDSASRVTAIRSTVTGNGFPESDGNGSEGAGIFVAGGGMLNMYESVVSGNAGGKATIGGGIKNAGTLEMRNCLVYSNTFLRPGSADGILLAGGKATLLNCSIVGNGSVGMAYAGGTAAVSNSIIWGHTAADLTNFPAGSVGYCAVGVPRMQGVNGCITSDPLFVDADANDYRLKDAPFSPCIDSGAVQPWMAGASDFGGLSRVAGKSVDMGAYEYRPPSIIRNAGVSNITAKTAVIWGGLTWPGAANVALSLFHGPADGGTNPKAWENEIKLSGLRGKGLHEATISHSASNCVWFYRYCATNPYGVFWAESSGSLIGGAVEVKATKRESTEEKPASFVITRPATAVNAPLAVYFTLGGTGRNGEDYDSLESPAIIPAGATEVRLPVVPSFREDDKRPRGVELTIAPGGYQIGLNGKASIVTKVQ